MKHRSYDHINGVWHNKTMEYFEEMGFFADDVEWCVTEKVHGSNFAFHQTATGLQFATRKTYITGDKQFHQHLRMTPDNVHKCTSIWNDLQEHLGDIKEMIIYGEIFGGSYPHEDIKPLRQVSRIQKGIYYHPDVNFYAYDIWIKTSISEFFMDYDYAVELFESYNMFHAIMLFRGTYEACSMFPDKFESGIPLLLGLPMIKGNICEGVVLKPIMGLTTEGGDRVILKSKNDEANKKMRERKPKNQKPTTELSHDLRVIVDSLIPFITETRLRNVLSKHIEFTKTDFNVIYKGFKEEVYQDYEEANNELNLFNPQELKLIEKEVGRLCIDIWKPIYMREVQ